MSVALEQRLLEQDGRLLVVRFPDPQRVLSWAVANGGFALAREIAIRHVADDELGPGTDPEALLATELARAGIPRAVGMLTARDLSRYEEAEAREGGLQARCIATVGLGNALAAGDPPGPLLRRVGTINVICHVSEPLSTLALIEALALVAEARTAAVLDAGVESARSGRPATGTGTDCIAVAAPATGRALPFAGKHTSAGAALGRAVREAVSAGVLRWQRERGLR